MEELPTLRICRPFPVMYIGCSNFVSFFFTVNKMIVGVFISSISG